MTAEPVRRRWFQPTSADLAFAVLALVIFQSARGRMLSDPGLGWHLRNIDAMIAKRGWLTEDPFSGPRGGRPWLTNQWLGELPLWLGERWAGLEGIAAMATLVLALTFRCLYRMLQCDGLPWPAAALWTALAAGGTSCAWVARPNLFTLLFTLLTFRACESFHTGRGGARQLAWLFPLFVVWANVHGGFVAGLLVVAACCGIEMLLAVCASGSAERSEARRKAGVFGAVAAGCIIATFVNPYGPALYRWVFQLLGDRYFMDLHVEWKPPQFGGEGAFQFECLMLLFPLLLALSGRRPNAVELGVSVLFFHFALTGLRYLPIWVLMVTPLLARSAAEVPVLKTITERHRASREQGRTFSGAPAWQPWLWTAATAVALFAGTRLVEGRIASILPEIIPTESLERVLDLHREDPGRVVFHGYNWGGYLTWRGWSPGPDGFKNWIDDRNEVQGREHVENYFALMRADPGWQGSLDAARVALVCIPPDTPLADRLRQQPGWRSVDRNQYAEIFQRRPLDEPKRPPVARLP